VREEITRLNMFTSPGLLNAHVTYATPSQCRTHAPLSPTFI